jgi:glutaredoxin-related protein
MDRDSSSSDSDSDHEQKKKGKKDEHQTSNYLSQAVMQNVAGISLPILNCGSIELPDPKFGCSMIFCGSTRSGKTTLLNYLFKRHFENHISVLMSNSLNSDAYDYLKKHCVTSDFYFPELLKEMYKINHATKNHYEFLAVIDDVPDKREDAEMKRLMTIYRNSRISCMVCAQGATMVNKLARSNINWVFLGRMNSSSEVERNIKDYLQGHLPTTMKMTEKIAWYRQATSNYQWIVLDNINGHLFVTKLQPSQIIGT